MNLNDILDGYSNKSFSVHEVFTTFLQQIDKYESKVHSFITRIDINPKDGSNAIPIAHKDIYSTKGIETTAASHILKGYVPPYSATSVIRLESKGFETLGKLNCDAFAHGTTGENSDIVITKNPYDLSRVPGGSSSGSAAAVAAGFVPVATATDTGGSIRLPSSYTNTVGIKPTYGRVSRYGVIAMTSSTDSIGHITKTVWDSAYVLGITAGYDEHDATSSRIDVPAYTEHIDDGVSGMTLGLPKEYLVNIDPEIERVFNEVVATYEKLGARIVEVAISPNL